MSIVIKEQDILKKEAPHAVGFWDEASIRSYQESYGINYGASVFVRGVSPNREWSNDRDFNQTVQQVSESNTDALKGEVKPNEVETLKAQIEALETMIKRMAIPKLEPLTNVERHGLEPEKLDKRTREYKESQKVA